MALTAILKREYLPDRTLGEFTLFENGSEIYRFFTLEREWDNNKKGKSCIPEGTYKVIPNNTKAHPDTFRIPNVKGRTGILIHIGNHVYHSEGCILLGMIRIDLDGDGKPDLKTSKRAMDMLHGFVGLRNFELTITKKK